MFLIVLLCGNDIDWTTLACQKRSVIIKLLTAKLEPEVWNIRGIISLDYIVYLTGFVLKFNELFLRLHRRIENLNWINRLRAFNFTDKRCVSKR